MGRGLDEFRRDLLIDGSRLTVVDCGHGQRTVLLVHGLAASWDYWRPTIPALTASHRVIAVDLPGFGYSENRSNYGPLESVRVLVALLDQEGLDRVDVIGHSMGTIIASELAARFPERVARLVLTGGPIISVIDLPNHPVRTLRRSPEVASFVVEALTAGIKPPAAIRHLILRRRWARKLALGTYVPHPELLAEDVIDGVLRGVGARAVLPTLYGGWWWGYDLREALAAVQCPSLVIAGGRDTIAPLADAYEFARIARGQPTIKTLPAAGHWPMLEDPANFNRLLLEWLCPADECSPANVARPQMDSPTQPLPH